MVVHYDLLQHIVEKESDRRERYVNFILPTLLDPFEVWNPQYKDTTRRRYIGLFKGEKYLFVSIRINKDRSFFWNIMHSGLATLNRHKEMR